MRNKDLLWVRPDYAAGKIVPENPARGGGRKSSKGDPFVDDHKQEFFTVAQIASMWNLSDDTVRRLFEDEEGVITLGNKNPRNKHRRITLRIPRKVMERVKKVRSNTE